MQYVGSSDSLDSSLQEEEGSPSLLREEEEEEEVEARPARRVSTPPGPSSSQPRLAEPSQLVFSPSADNPISFPHCKLFLHNRHAFKVLFRIQASVPDLFRLSTAKGLLLGSSSLTIYVTVNKQADVTRRLVDEGVVKAKLLVEFRGEDGKMLSKGEKQVIPCQVRAAKGEGMAEKPPMRAKKVALVEEEHKERNEAVRVLEDEPIVPQRPILVAYLPLLLSATVVLFISLFYPAASSDPADRSSSPLWLSFVCGCIGMYLQIKTLTDVEREEERVRQRRSPRRAARAPAAR